MNPGIARFAPAGIVIAFARRRGAGPAIVAVLVEILRLGVGVVLAHVDLEFARRAPPLPAIVAIAQSEVALGEEEAQPLPRQELDVEEAEEQSAQMREV